MTAPDCASNDYVFCDVGSRHVSSPTSSSRAKCLDSYPSAQHFPIVRMARHHKCGWEGAIAADRLLAFFSEHSVKVVLLLLLVGGLVAWLTTVSSEGDPVRALHGRC